jgi:mannose/cellobiose epimerase-like protein (N-acyl-D-glucosamine 2-epimerase family)
MTIMQRLTMTDTPFIDRAYHRRWLLDQARDLIDFFQAHAVNADGGFYTLDDDGQPLDEAEQELFYNCRMVHCFAAVHALGHPGAMRLVDHGMTFLLDRHVDTEHGGFFWGVGQDGPTRPDKLAYGHAFVLLAAASAQEVGHPKAGQLHDLAIRAIDAHFWDEDAGAMRAEFSADWTPLSDYRGQNANMHSVEALMAAFEAFDEPRYLTMAERIADLIINRHARATGWVVIEHFHADWSPDLTYAGDPMFRPAGTTPGHALEWARLLIQLWHLGGKRQDWMPDAARQLFRKAIETGWDQENGGFYYTLDFEDRPDERLLLWWPACEGVAAAATLQAAFDDAEVEEEFYRKIWATLARDFIDPAGGWYPVSRATDGTGANPFKGKPDIYHSLQACLIPLLPVHQGLLKGLPYLQV